MSIQPAQPQSIGGVLDTTFQLYKASLVKVIPLALLMVLASSPTSIYMMTQGAGAGAATDPFAMLNMIRSPGYWLAGGIGMIASMWMLSAMYLKIGALGAGDELGVGAALQSALTRLVTVVLMVILFAIALTVGFVLLVIPGLILAVSLALCFNTALFENKGPVDALTVSHRLVWGNWWRTAAVMTVGFIIIMVIYFVAALIIGVVTPLLVMGGGTENLLLYTLISSVLIGVLMNVLVTPFYISMAIAIYWDLKLRRDGGDLAARVGALNPA